MLSDDLRLYSGIGTMSKEIVLNTIDKYDWVQLGAAVKHPDHGKIMDASDDAAAQTGVHDAYLKIYPFSGYGSDQDLNYPFPSIIKRAMSHKSKKNFRNWYRLWLSNCSSRLFKTRYIYNRKRPCLI